MRLRMRRLGSASLPVLGISVSVAAFDWLKSMDYRFFSTMWGVYYFAGAGFCSIPVIVILLTFSACSKGPRPDADNGGLYLPEGFSALKVVDSLPGLARHLAVNDNGDIYVKGRKETT